MTGFSHGFLVSAAISLLALVIALAAIRVTREDLSGVDPLAAMEQNRAPGRLFRPAWRRSC